MSRKPKKMNYDDFDSFEEVEEHTYVCDVCGETYIGKNRKWTCPCCGSADSFDAMSNSYEDLEEDEDEYDEY